MIIKDKFIRGGLFIDIQVSISDQN
jgi:hypothetical protein